MGRGVLLDHQRQVQGVAAFGSGPAGRELQGTTGGTAGDVPEAQDQTLIVLSGFAGQQGTAGEVDVERFQAGNGRRLSRRLQELEKKGDTAIVFVGPAIVNEFVETTIAEENLKLKLVAHFSAAGKLASLADDNFDTVLLFDEYTEGLQQVAVETGIAGEKLALLW